METVAFCETDEFCHRVLAHHWPGVPIHGDIRELTGDAVGPVDVITGGFPCQDISAAGLRAGINGERSGLWAEMFRLVSEVRPDFVIVENVANLLAGPRGRPGRWFGRILGDLAKIGYDAEWYCISATSVGVPQRRPRVWIVAYRPRSSGDQILHQNTFNVECYRAWMDDIGSKEANIDDKNRGACAVSILGDIEWTSIPYRERSGNNERLSVGLDRYRALGNAVVPQIPEMIGRAIMEAEQCPG